MWGREREEGRTDISVGLSGGYLANSHSGPATEKSAREAWEKHIDRAPLPERLSTQFTLYIQINLPVTFKLTLSGSAEGGEQ